MPAAVERRFSLPAVLFEVTSRCNLDCLYCYNIHKRPNAAPPVRGSRGETRATLERLFEVADVSKVTMSGGEPLLADGFLELVELCRGRGKEVLVTSNGNGPAGTYRALVGMGVRTFVFPFHSDSAEEHDAMTGRPGSHARAAASLELVRGLGASATPIMVITRLNLASVERTLLALKRRGFRRIIVNRFNLGGRGIVERRRIGIDVAELRDAFRTADEVAEKCGLRLTSNICTPRCVLDPRDYPRIGFGACDLDFSNRPFTLDSVGGVRFCNHSPVVMGNIHGDDLAAIFSSEYARRWETSRPAPCADCSSWKECAGGCRAASEQLGSDMTEIDPVARGHAEARRAS